jgi:hypothetical protein
MLFICTRIWPDVAIAIGGERRLLCRLIGKSARIGETNTSAREIFLTWSQKHSYEGPTHSLCSHTYVKSHSDETMITLV